MTSSNRDSSMLWRLERVGNFFRISNKKYPGWKLGKTGNGDEDLVVFRGTDADDQLWDL